MKAKKLRVGYNKAQLKMGTRIELEHTKSKKLAERIAKDHLREHPEYYKYLAKMKKKLKAKKRG